MRGEPCIWAGAAPASGGNALEDSAAAQAELRRLKKLCQLLQERLVEREGGRHEVEDGMEVDLDRPPPREREDALSASGRHGGHAGAGEGGESVPMTMIQGGVVWQMEQRARRQSAHHLASLQAQHKHTTRTVQSAGLQTILVPETHNPRATPTEHHDQASVFQPAPAAPAEMVQAPRAARYVSTIQPRHKAWMDAGGAMDSTQLPPHIALEGRRVRAEESVGLVPMPIEAPSATVLVAPLPMVSPVEVQAAVQPTRTPVSSMRSSE